MVRNDVAGVDQKFGTNEACQAYLFSQQWPEGFACRRCHGRKYCGPTVHPLPSSADSAGPPPKSAIPPNRSYTQTASRVTKTLPHTKPGAQRQTGRVGDGSVSSGAFLRGPSGTPRKKTSTPLGIIPNSPRRLLPLITILRHRSAESPVRHKSFVPKMGYHGTTIVQGNV